MIWPWSELKYLRQQLDYHKSQMAHYEKWHRIYEKLYLERTRDLLASHKGIRRLVDRVNKLKAEHNRNITKETP